MEFTIDLKELDKRFDKIEKILNLLIEREALKCYTIEEASKLTGISYSTLRNEILKGNIGYIPDKSIKKITHQEIERLKQKMEVKPIQNLQKVG